MRKTETKEIDGFTISVMQLGGMRSLKLLHKLARAVAPAAMKAGGGRLAKLNLADLSGAVEGIFDRFSADDLEALTKELFELATVTVDGQAKPFMGQLELALAGRPGTILKALRFALEVNYEDFFSSLKGVIAELNILAPPSKPPT